MKQNASRSKDDIQGIFSSLLYLAQEAKTVGLKDMYNNIINLLAEESFMITNDILKSNNLSKEEACILEFLITFARSSPTVQKETITCIELLEKEEPENERH